MMDRDLAVIGKFPPLRVQSGQKATFVRPGMDFVQYNVKKGAYVTTADEVVVVEVNTGQEKGRQIALKPNIAGIVTATHERLVKGMSIDDSLSDSNLLTVGKMTPLEVDL